MLHIVAFGLQMFIFMIFSSNKVKIGIGLHHMYWLVYFIIECASVEADVSSGEWVKVADEKPAQLCIR